MTLGIGVVVRKGVIRNGEIPGRSRVAGKGEDH